MKVAGAVQYVQDYVGGIEYKNGLLEAIYHGEGRVVSANGALLYEYAMKDHLGNTRLMFGDRNNDGVITPDLNTELSEVTQENHFYPFGMNMDGVWENTPSITDNLYQYNGKEWNNDFGLGLNDYGARWYDPAIARWTTIDPLNEKMRRYSPYNYAFNNPMRFIDPDGLSPDGPGDPVDKPRITKANARGENSNRFHSVRTNKDGSTRKHQGVDISAPLGTEIHSIMNGEINEVTADVEENEETHGGDNSAPAHLGNHVTIKSKDKDGNTVYMRYGHLDKKSLANVKVGSTIKEGETVGQTGNTGNVKDAKPEFKHVHIEAATSGDFNTNTRIDPEQFMTNKFDGDGQPIEPPVPSPVIYSIKGMERDNTAIILINRILPKK